MNPTRKKDKIYEFIDQYIFITKPFNKKERDQLISVIIRLNECFDIYEEGREERMAELNKTEPFDLEAGE
jgi:hypothetical protein